MSGPPPAAVSARDPVVLCTPDEEYALAFAVAVHSAVRNLDPTRRLRLHVLDGGVSRATRRRLLRSWDPERVEVTWLAPDLERIRAVAVETYPWPSVYLRLLAPELLPGSLSKVIYLDSDVVVRADLGRLWECEMKGALLLAVQDTGMPFVDAERALPGYAACAPFLWKARAIENYEAHGIDPGSKYFNSGVLVMNLEGWRREGISQRLLACLRENRAYATLPDQYVLNSVLAGRWRELDLRWNVAPAIFRYPSAAQSPFAEAVFAQARADPWIVHYVGVEKPWRRDFHPPWQEDFQRTLDEMGWPRWRRLRWTWWPWLRERVGKRLRRAARRGRRAARRVARAGRRLRSAARPRPWLRRVPVGRLRCDAVHYQGQAFAGQPLEAFPMVAIFRAYQQDPDRAHGLFRSWMRAWFLDRDGWKTPASQGGMTDGPLYRTVCALYEQRHGRTLTDPRTAEPELIDEAIALRARHYLENVFDSIRRDGFDEARTPPITGVRVGKDTMIKAGHHRASALLVLGYKDVPIGPPKRR